MKNNSSKYCLLLGTALLGLYFQANSVHADATGQLMEKLPIAMLCQWFRLIRMRQVHRKQLLIGLTQPNIKMTFQFRF